MLYIHRTLEEQMTPLLSRKEAIAIVGPRQAGKTTLLLHLKESLTQQKHKVKYLTFDNRADLELFQDSIDSFKALHKDYDSIIIDEFHYAKEGGEKLKYLYDTTRVKFIISGSSSLELTFQTGKYMVGRMFTLHLWPFSFKEYISIKDKDLHRLLIENKEDLFDTASPKFLDNQINKRIENYFREYIIFGGYPAPALESDLEIKKQLLASILNNYLLKDIKSLLSLITDQELVNLSKFLATQIGNLINYQELSSASGLSVVNVKKHLKILEETYILTIIKPFFTNKRLELIKTPKVYFHDTGFRNLIMENFNPLEIRGDKGALIENFVCTHLLLRQGAFSPLHFWRTKSQAEVDFVIQTGESVVPVEVKCSETPSIGKSLYSFIDKFSPEKAFVLTMGYTDIRIIGKTTVIFAPVYYL